MVLCTVHSRVVWSSSLALLRQRLGDRLTAVIHDDACHVLRYSPKHQNTSPLARQISSMSWVLDRFHSAGHVDSWCKERCHPSVHEELMRDVNSSACERVNAQLGRHKFVYRAMQKGNSTFFLSEVVDSRNLLT